ncbi:hypothetical protein [Rhodopirellula bahusiensis]|uniref:hypothetical protein n=1 Tax=Rhodopirellula bahusiensis TaxID=2014065 RepID=UPI0032662381
MSHWVQFANDGWNATSPMSQSYIGGGDLLQQTYPGLSVENDSQVSFVKDRKMISSNGNLASYISALELLEEMTDSAHRKFVESHLYLERLQNYER